MNDLVKDDQILEERSSLTIEISDSNDEEYMQDFQNALENILEPKNDLTKKKEAGIDGIFAVVDRKRKNVDPNMLQKQIEKHGTIKGKEPPMPITSWIGCGLSDSCLLRLEEMKCKQPVAVQCLSIPAILESRDVVVVAETGSGKTLCYCIPIVRMVAVEKQRWKGSKGPFCAIIVCSRELADQVGRILRDLLFGAGIKVCVAHGGRDVSRDLVEVSSCDVFIGCPGRAVDILTKRKNASIFKKVRFIVFDEADRLFDDGFRPQIEKICTLLPEKTQKALFTATMPGFINKMAKKILNNPLSIWSGSRLGLSQSLEQSVEIFQKEEDRFFRLLEILGEQVSNRNQVLVFVEKRNDLEELYLSLQMHGHKSLTIYAEMDPVDRRIAMQDFTTIDDESECFILVTTGLAGRGIDIPTLSLVINYTTPPCLEEYVHRVGRTARGGATGKSITFLLQPYENIHSLYLLQALDNGKSDLSTIDALTKVAQEASGDSKLVLWTPKASFKSYAGHGYSFDREERKQSHKKKRLYQREKMQVLGMGNTLPDHTEKSQALVTVDENFLTDRAPVVSNIMKATGKELSLKTGDAKARAIAIAAAISEAKELEATTSMHTVKILINDYSLRIRRMLTNRTMMQELIDDFSIDISFHGEYKKGHALLDSKLHLVLTGSSKIVIEKAREKIEAFIRHEKKFELI